MGTGMGSIFWFGNATVSNFSVTAKGKSSVSHLNYKVNQYSAAIIFKNSPKIHQQIMNIYEAVNAK